MSTDSLVTKVAARYKSKKKLDSGTTVYVYSPNQVSRRNNEKADRIEKLRGKLPNLRKKVKRDLASKDLKTRLTALVVALIDHTYERVGNDQSAEERGHFGVTGWQRQHLSLGKGKVTIKYVGKSGVKHTKTVDDPSIIPALKEAYDSVEKETDGLFGDVSASDVNSYLEEFDITAKDLRGFHANREMQERLTKARAKGGELPSSPKERKEVLKKEFTKALEETAKAVGHEASTLRNQYLAPALEEVYMKDGTVISKLNEKKAGLDNEEPQPLVFANRVIRQLVDHMVGPQFVTDETDFQIIRGVFRSAGGSWEKFLNGDLQSNELLKNSVIAWSKVPGRKQKPETK